MFLLVPLELHKNSAVFYEIHVCAFYPIPWLYVYIERYWPVVVFKYHMYQNERKDFF
jgi:hypothetical protein